MELIEIPAFRIRGQPPEILPEIKAQLLQGNCFVAGGSILKWVSGGSYETDIDIYPIQGQFPFLFDVFNSLPQCTIITDSPIGVLFRISDTIPQEYHLVKISFSSLSNVLKSFDFSICQVGYDGSKLWGTVNALFSIELKCLEYNKDRNVGYFRSLQRAMKYTARGYRLSVDDLKYLVEKSTASVIPQSELVYDGY